MSSAGIASDLAPTMVDLLGRVSIEIAAGRPRAIDALRDAFDPGTQVFVNFLPGGDYRSLLATAVGLKRAGFNPVPHVAARSLPGREALDDFVGRAAGEAGVTRMLLIAGDRDPPAGPFASTMELLATGVFQARGIGAVGVAGHPEGHARIGGPELFAALKAKADYARREGLGLFVVTQFCFEAPPILDWLAETRRAGIAAPVHVGIAGPATMATLIRFALACGVGNSLRALRARPNAVGRLLGVSGPEELVRDVAAGLATMADHGVAGLHIFPFGGVQRAGVWLTETLARVYADVAPRAG